MEEKFEDIIKHFVDYLQPELTPYEVALYLYLLRNSVLKSRTSEIRVGKRTVALEFGKGARGESTSYAHISEILQRLEQKGCIKIGNADRFGTLYTVILPEDVPIVAEKIAKQMLLKVDDDYFTNKDKRHVIFERDKWICQYCGEEVNQQNATLDHFIPKSKGGDNSRDNLKTCCLLCNSIKSGKTYEEAAPLLLKSIQERRSRSNK
jgi:hypothetical protein